ncbi:helix-turn-helix transcriptional regulator [Staphylococcus debuckii]|uniref:Helix-turn-helix transcriptional regulator n=1 Tax=Staphylococcus debuckii TaxID=2044912 RepID=A0ABU9EXR5_9STAP
MIKFKLKEIMENKNMKISDLNKKTGISRNSLSLLINGKSRGIQFETLEKIIGALNIEIGDLFEKTFDKLEIVLHNKTKIHYNMNNSLAHKRERLSNKKYNALESTIYEDNIIRKGYIPYDLKLNFEEKPYWSIEIKTQYSEFHKLLKSLFKNNEYLSIVFSYYFAKKIMMHEKENIDKVKKHFKVNDDFFYVSIPRVVLIGNTIFTDIEGDKEVKKLLNYINESDNIEVEYDDSMVIINK